jgi:hypothetical protein
MALDPSIPLQAKAPDFNPLATLLQVQQYKNLQQTGNRLQLDTDANQAVGQAIQRNTGPDGKLNLLGVQRDLAGNPAAAYNLQAATGQNLAQQGQQISNQGGQISNDTNMFALHKDYANTMLQTAQGVLADKRITAPVGQYDPAQATDALSEAMSQAEAKGVPRAQALLAVAPFVNAVHQPGAVAAMLQNSLRGQLAASQQLGALTPTPTPTTDGATTEFRDTNPITNPGIVGTKIEQRLSPAQATGRMPTVGPDGQPGSIPFSDTVPPNLLPPGMQGGQQQAPGRYPQPQATRPGFIPSGQAPGVGEAATAAGQGAGQQLLADQASNAESGKRVNMLQNAADALSKAQTGTGADKLNAVRGVVAMLGGPADKVASYDEANKYLTQYAQQKAASFGHATDAQLSAALTGNGNTHISNLAAQDVVKVNMALERMDQARMQAWQSAGLPPAQYSQWKSQFGAAMDPRVFVADQLPAAKVGAMVKAMNAKEQATFRQQYNWAVQNGYINGPQ